MTRETGYVGLSRARVENHVYTTAAQMTAAIECDVDPAGVAPDEEKDTDALARRLRTSRTHRLATQQHPEANAWRSPHAPDEPIRSRAEGISR